MNCKTCNIENAEEANFCAYCGASLTNTCPSCHNINPPESVFCSQCGISLTTTNVPQESPLRGNSHIATYGSEESCGIGGSHSDSRQKRNFCADKHTDDSEYERYGEDNRSNYNNQIKVQPTNRQLAAGLLGIIFGTLGIHNFYLKRKRAAAQLVITLCGYILLIISYIIIATSARGGNSLNYIQFDEVALSIGLVFLSLGLLLIATTVIWAVVESICILTGWDKDSRI